MTYKKSLKNVQHAVKMIACDSNIYADLYEKENWRPERPCPLGSVRIRVHHNGPDAFFVAHCHKLNEGGFDTAYAARLYRRAIRARHMRALAVKILGLEPNFIGAPRWESKGKLSALRRKFARDLGGCFGVGVNPCPKLRNRITGVYFHGYLKTPRYYWRFDEDLLGVTINTPEGQIALDEHQTV
jgi:hypothetical protein